jgi:hypothetical protein
MEGFFMPKFPLGAGGGKWVKNGERWLKKGKSGVKWGIMQVVEPAIRQRFI